jgi:peptidoglycan L-alanyl-D-glutamate endopeptidase CwlK
MPFSLTAASQEKLSKVHPDLIRVVNKAITITSVGFQVTEGLRTLARQRQLVAAGASQTLKSRHLTGPAGELVATVNGKIRWDWPLYYKLADAMKQAAIFEHVPIEWGGDWKTFKDGPHFQLPWKQYP